MALISDKPLTGGQMLLAWLLIAAFCAASWLALFGLVSRL